MSSPPAERPRKAISWLIFANRNHARKACEILRHMTGDWCRVIRHDQGFRVIRFDREGREAAQG